MNGRVLALLAAVALLAACAGPAVPSPEPSAAAQRVGGPGWSIELPAALGLAEGPVPPTELTGTWEVRDSQGGVRQVSVLVNRESAAPLDDYFDAVELAPGTRIEQEAPVQVSPGRARWFRVGNVDTPSHDLVLVEPAPGTIVSISASGVGADALVGIARTLVVESP